MNKVVHILSRFSVLKIGISYLRADGRIRSKGLSVVKAQRRALRALRG